MSRRCFLCYNTELAGGVEEALHAAKIVFEAEEGHLRCEATPGEIKKALAKHKLPSNGWKAAWVPTKVPSTGADVSVISDEI